MPANWDEASVKSAQKLVKQLKNVFEATFIEEDTATALADSLFDLFDECYQTVKPEELRRRLKSFINSSYLISDILKKKDETNYGIAVHFDTDTMSGPLATSAGAITIQIMAIGYRPDPLLETRYIPSMEIEKGKGAVFREGTARTYCGPLCADRRGGQLRTLWPRSH